MEKSISGSLSEPKILETIPVKDVLEILKAQLEILKVLSNPMVFISQESDFARDMRRR